MFLCIDTSAPDVCVLQLFDVEAVHVAEYAGNNRQVLTHIDEYLAKQEILPQDVQGILVVVGEGSFTSTRIAVTVANTFAYVNHIPVLAISSAQGTRVQACIPDLLAQTSGQYVSATYSSAPHINLPA